MKTMAYHGENQRILGLYTSTISHNIFIRAVISSYFFYLSYIRLFFHSFINIYRYKETDSISICANKLFFLLFYYQHLCPVHPSPSCAKLIPRPLPLLRPGEHSNLHMVLTFLGHLSSFRASCTHFPWWSPTFQHSSTANSNDPMEFLFIFRSWSWAGAKSALFTLNSQEKQGVASFSAGSPKAHGQAGQALEQARR